MKFRPGQFLSFRLALIALSLFSVAQVTAEQTELMNDSFTISGRATGMHGESGLNYEPILLSSFLLIASCLLLTKKLRGVIAAVVLSGLVLYITLPLYFWNVAATAEVQRYSGLHFRIWWNNLSAGQLVQIILAAFVLSFSAASFASARVRRRRFESPYP
jgi:hypothetical protein